MNERADVMKLFIEKGIYNLDTIRGEYNRFAEGGNTNPHTVGATVNALYASNPREEFLGEPSHHYDFTQSEEWANEHGYYPDARGHRDDRVKKLTHPSHPSRGTWNGDKFELADLGMQNPNYTLFGLNDGGQDPQAVLTYQGGIVLPEVTVTPNENYFYNPYDNIILHQKANGGKIHIKPSKKGTFTAAAKKHGKSVQAFASQVLAHPENYSPAMVKKANFARNASHWKHGLGGNLVEEAGQMQIGRPFWQSQTQEPSFMESLAEFNRQQETKKQQQRKALKERIDTVGKRLTEGRMREASIEPNDNAWIDNRLTYKKKNPHLSRRAEEGAKAHAAWEKEHPNLTAWGNLAGAVPFAVASVPLSAGIVAGGDALAATTVGQAVTSGLAPLYQAATGATIAGAPALAWANTGLQSLMASHGLSEATNGTFTPTTALELTPLAPGIVRTPGIINNLRPQNIRNHWYVAKPPIGYDGIGDAVERWIRGVASGKSASIDNPWWFNNSSAKHLQDYAYVPKTVQGIEREQYLQQFGEHALKARADAWRTHNLIPQKYNTFTPNPRHPGSFTDVEGIRRLKYIPPQTEGRAQIDFVNSVGGNVGVPEITNLGNGIPDAGTQIKRFGVTTTSDWFDLHPFSRKGDRLRERFVKPFWDKHIAAPILYDARWMRKAADKLQYNEAEAKAYLAQNKDNELAMELFDPDMFPTTGIRRKIGDAFEALSNRFKRAARTPEFGFLKPLEDKMAKLEAGDITGGKPFLVQYDIPFTTNIRFTSEAPGVVTEQIPGFVSENLLPQSVLNWKHGVSTEPANINLENNFDFLNTTLTKKSKR